MPFGKVLKFETNYGEIIPDKGDGQDSKIYFNLEKRCNIKDRSRKPLPGDRITYVEVFNAGRRRPEASPWAFADEMPAGGQLGVAAPVNARKHQMSRRAW